MIADARFLGHDMAFWANVRSISEKHGYTERGSHQIKVPSIVSIQETLAALQLDAHHIVKPSGQTTALGRLLSDYFEYRADRLNRFVEPRLMTASQAQKEFERLQKQYRSNLPVPLNKQSGEMKKPAYLTGIVNILIEANCRGLECDFAPNRLTTFTRNGQPLRTLARRVDGAFPSTVNPIAIWEIKEYYYTTTFGSRVADGVYETLLDGLELQELYENEGVAAKHYLMVDAHYTWWEKGRSYLCRIFDMLHMGYIDEVLFGREVIERLPSLVKEWANLAEARDASTKSKIGQYAATKGKQRRRPIKETASPETTFQTTPELPETPPEPLECSEN